MIQLTVRPKCQRTWLLYSLHQIQNSEAVKIRNKYIKFVKIKRTDERRNKNITKILEYIILKNKVN